MEPLIVNPHLLVWFLTSPETPLNVICTNYEFLILLTFSSNQYSCFGHADVTSGFSLSFLKEQIQIVDNRLILARWMRSHGYILQVHCIVHSHHQLHETQVKIIWRQTNLFCIFISIIFSSLTIVTYPSCSNCKARMQDATASKIQTKL